MLVGASQRSQLLRENAQRVIAFVSEVASGSLTGYGGGLERKKALLDLEKSRYTGPDRFPGTPASTKACAPQ